MPPEPTLLLCHGAGGADRHSAVFAARLAARYEVVDVSYPGWRRRPTVADMAAFAFEQASALPAAPIVVIGYSLGAAISVMVAARLAARGGVLGFVAIDPVIAIGSVPKPGWGMRAVRDLRDEVRLFGAPALPAFAASRAVRLGIRLSGVPRAQRVAALVRMPLLERELDIAAALAAVRITDLGASLPPLATPALLIRPPAETEMDAFWRNRLPILRIADARSSHHTILHDAAVIDALADFVTRLPR